MRTSLSQQIQSSLIYTSTASDRLVKAQNHAVSGKRIMRPSDDVPGTNRALSLRSSISTVQQFTNNIVVSKPLMQTTLGAMQDMVDQVQKVMVIANEAANSTAESKKDTLTAELDAILDQMVDIANTKHGDQFVFSGTATNTAPMVKTAVGPEPYAYVGNSGIRTAQVLSWVSLPLNIPGDQMFNFDGAAGADTTDLFTMVTQLKDKIQNADPTAVSNELKNIEANLNNLLSHTARMGSWTARVESAQSTLLETENRLKEMLSDTEDIDLTQAVVELKTQENVYQTALAITTRMLDLSLASMNLQ